MSEQGMNEGWARQWVREAIAQSGRPPPQPEMTYAVEGVSVRVLGAHTALLLIPAAKTVSDEGAS